MAYQGNQIDYNNLNDELKLKLDKAEGVESQVQTLAPKVDNSWQMNKYNATSSMNLGDISHTKAFSFRTDEWKSTTNTEILYIVFPSLTVFSGIIKLTVSSNYNSTDAGGGCTVEYNTQFYSGTLNKYSKNIISISPSFSKNYYLEDLALDNVDKHLVIPIFKAPTANNAMFIEVTLIGSNIPNDIMSKAHLVSSDSGSPTALGYPWTPQTTSFLAVNTYSPNNTITNIGANRATRVFPQINWKAQGIELWESFISLPASLWGILELDIAGYSAAAGGAKIVVELGINVINQTQPSDEFRNYMKIVSASAGFTENFYIEVEHRADARMVLIKVYKRVLNDPITITATFTSTASPMSAFEFLKGFNNGALYTNIAGVPTARQKDFDARITENFTSVSNGKAQVASAITGKGVQTASDATFSQMANNINQIQTGRKDVQGFFSLPSIAPYANQEVIVGTFPFNPRNYCSDLSGVQMCNGVHAQTPNEPMVIGSYFQPIVNNGNGTWTLKLVVKNNTNMTNSPRNVNFLVTE